MHGTGPSGSFAPDSTPPGVPITEAAARLGMNRETLRQQIRRGKVAACKVEGQWYVDLSSVLPLAGALPRSANGAPDGAVASAPSAPANPPSSAVNSATSGTVEPTRVAQLHSENQLLREDVAFLREELRRKDELLRGEQDTRRREVSELHILLQRAQAQLALPAAAAQPVHEHQEDHRSERHRRWWWPWTR